MTLRTGTPEQIQEMFVILQRSSRELINQVVELVYFMRGGVQYDDMMYRTPGERQIMTKFLEKMIEKESKISHHINASELPPN
jgi:hypothetical protein